MSLRNESPGLTQVELDELNNLTRKFRGGYLLSALELNRMDFLTDRHKQTSKTDTQIRRKPTSDK